MENIDSNEATNANMTFSSANWRGMIVVALVLGVAWINLSRVPMTSAAAGAGTQAPMIGFLAPDFLLDTSDNNVIQLSSLRGQAVVVNFWATWCPPCRAEMPELEQVWQQFSQQGVVILGVDQGESATVVNRFARDRVGVTFPLLLDRDQTVGATYQVRALPTTYFIDAEGRIQDIKIGGPLNRATLLDGLANAMHQ